MMYELLLLQDGGIAIPTTYPDQADNSKDGTDPMSRERCKLFFWNGVGFDRHLHGGHCLIHPAVPSRCANLPKLPKLSVSILRTCRLIHSEAVSMLYKRNFFYFGDPRSISEFRQKADRIHADLVHEVHIKLASFVSEWAWLRYMAQDSSDFAKDFPLVRRMSIDLDRDARKAYASKIRHVLQSLWRQLPNLDSVRFNMWGEESSVTYYDRKVA